MTFTIQTAILGPAAVLIAWSLVVLLWTVFTRLPAFKNAGIELATAPPGGRFSDLEEQLPPQVTWVSHNHTHLMEQPTIFHAVVMVLALTQASDTSVLLAWAYVILRIAHSLWQNLVNTIPVWFGLFALSTGCLIALSINALLATLT